MPDQKRPQVAAPTYVTVFGAGVAGLTVAHELVERGFRVQVWEPQGDDRVPRRGCDVGGLARTQWSRAHWPEWAEPATKPLPRIGKKPYELWVNQDNQWVAQGPLQYPDQSSRVRRKWTPKAVFQALSRDLALLGLDKKDTTAGKKETTVTVSVRYPSVRDGGGPPLDAAEMAKHKNGFRRLLAWVGWNPRPDGDDLVCKRKGQVSVRFAFEWREEKGHRRRLAWVLSKSRSFELRFEFLHRPAWGVETRPIVQLPQKFYAKENVEDLGALGAFGSQDPIAVAEEIVRTVVDCWWIEQFYAEVAFRSPDVSENTTDATEKSTDRPKKTTDVLVNAWSQAETKRVAELIRVIDGLKSKIDPKAKLGTPTQSTLDRLDLAWFVGGRLVDITLVRLDTFPEGIPDKKVTGVGGFRVRERWFPGEHGYRFFPAFYHHLFDTMKRTPILELAPKSKIEASQERAVLVEASTQQLVETGQTVYDNIVPRPNTILASMNGRQTVVRRFQVASLSELAQRFHSLLGSSEKKEGMGFSPRELNRMGLKALQYMTSCEKRRVELEEISWFDYLRADTFSPEAQKALKEFPAALIAMDAKESDARTIGSVGTQVLLDQFSTSGYRDGALNGPTSTSWLEQWRIYLEAQGVEFIQGEIVGFKVVTEPTATASRTGKANHRLWPAVHCYEPRYLADAFGEVGEKKGEITEPALLPGYFVLALPAPKIQEIAQAACEVAGNKVPLGDLVAAANIPPFDADLADPGNGMKHFAGVQYYFEEDVYWVDGHIYFQDSPWGLTAISQTRRWADRPDWEHGYRGILSTIIGVWDQPGEYVRKQAWECSPEEIAYEIWQQVLRGLQREDKPRLPEPVHWHLDDNFRWDPLRKAWTNVYPYQIQKKKLWKARPGNVDDKGYDVAGGIVLAGTYMKTHTRVTSMEAANESGRHAVNAILKDSAATSRATPCDIFPIEEREIDDLAWAKRLDERLHAKGLPHALEILEADDFAANFMSGGSEDPLNPMYLLERLRKFALGIPRHPSDTTVRSAAR